MVSAVYLVGKALLRVTCEEPEVLSLFENDTTPFIRGLSRDETLATPAVTVTAKRGSPASVPADAREILLHNRDVPLYGSIWSRPPLRYIYNPHYASLYTIQNRDVHIEYGGDFFDAFIGMRLTLFPLLYRISDHIGTVTLHASAASGPGGGFLFCGPKGAGKTSVALTLAAVSGYMFIANDYCMVSTDGQARVDGVPEPIRVASGTYDSMARQLSWSRDVSVILGKRYLNIRDARHHLGLAAGAALTAVFLPVLSEDGQFAAKPVPAADAVSALVAESMEVAGYQTPALVDAGPGVARGELCRRLSGWLGDTPCFAVTVPQRLIGTGLLSARLEDLLNGG